MKLSKNMKRIEIETVLPSKSQWEFAILPNIHFGYTNGCYFIAFGWLLWHVVIIINKSK